MFWNFSLNSYWKLGGKMLDCELRGWRAERVQPSHLAAFFLTRAVFAINLVALCPNLRFLFVFARLRNNFASHTRRFSLSAAFLFFSFCIQTVDWSSWVCFSQILSEFCLFGWVGGWSPFGYQVQLNVALTSIWGSCCHLQVKETFISGKNICMLEKNRGIRITQHRMPTWPHPSK